MLITIVIVILNSTLTPVVPTLLLVQVWVAQVSTKGEPIKRNVSVETRSFDHLTINSNNNLSMIVKNIFREMWDSVLPVLTTTITITVQSVLQSEMVKVRDRFNADLNILNYHIDELEQYTRRDSLRIGGLKEEGEDLVPKICSILSEVGCPISPDDISTCHRVGRRGRAPGPKPRQIICKLVRRSKKIEILRNKRNLRSSDGKRCFYL